MLTWKWLCFHWHQSQVSRLVSSWRDRACARACVCRWEGPVVCNDSSAWIKCGTLIWVKIMESYMSLNMSAFHRGPKWKVMAGRSWGGRKRCWNGNWVAPRPSLWLTCSQMEDELAVIQHQAAKNFILSYSAFFFFFTCLLMGCSSEANQYTEFTSSFTITEVLQIWKAVSATKKQIINQEKKKKQCFLPPISNPKLPKAMTYCMAKKMPETKVHI